MQHKQIDIDTKLALMSKSEGFEEEFCVNLLLQTGMKSSDLANLRKENVNWEEKKIHIGSQIFPLTNLAGWDITLAQVKELKLPLTKEVIENNIQNVVERANLKKGQIMSLLA